MGMVIVHFEIFWIALGQRLYHLPNLLLFTFSGYTNEVIKIGRRQEIFQTFQDWGKGGGLDPPPSLPGALSTCSEQVVHNQNIIVMPFYWLYWLKFYIFRRV